MTNTVSREGDPKSLVWLPAAANGALLFILGAIYVFTYNKLPTSK